MKLNLSKDTTFYILAPADIDTGGPKDLHQLGYELKNLGKNVFMFYFPNENKNPVHKNYRIYDLPYTHEIKDEKKNILIIPEINKTISISKKYRNIQKAIWWLSLDFFFVTKFYDNFPKFIRSIIKIPFNLICLFNKLTKNIFGNLSLPKYLKLIYVNFPFKNNLRIKDIDINLSQSEYQYEVLKTKNIDSFLLSDYIRDEYFKAEENISLEHKENIICYNPNKSSEFMSRIIRSNKDVKFVPLKGYSINELIEVLSKSKIYMDFGFHPGVDHLPREAAILKNCIITNKEGSAFYSNAVPINEEFKFYETNKNLSAINNLIKKIFNNFDEELVKFENYRKKLKDQKKTFKKQVKDIFN